MTAFSIDAIHPRDRLTIWREALSDRLVRLDCGSDRPAALSGTVTVLDCGGIRICTLRSVPQRLCRSIPHLLDGQEDYFLLLRQRQGSCEAAQDGRSALLSAGDLAICDATRPCTLTFPETFEQLVFLIPRDRLHRRAGRIQELTGRRIEAGQGMGRLLSALLDQMADTVEGLPPLLQSTVIDKMLDLLAGALVGERLEEPAARPPAQTTLLYRVKAYIDAHLGSPDLAPGGIARSAGVSVRYLNRLFEHEKTSLARYIWMCRFERCRRELADPCQSLRSICDIALAWGFRDPAHFSRGFRQRFGLSPSEWRSSALAGR